MVLVKPKLVAVNTFLKEKGGVTPSLVQPKLRSMILLVGNMIKENISV